MPGKRVWGALIAGWVAATSASVAFAADLPAYSVKAPPPAPAFSWSGIYIGGHVGYGWQKTAAHFSPANPITQFIFNLGGFPPTVGVDPRGFIGGGQLGYNWQLAPSWVVGIEADISGTAINRTQSAPGVGGTLFTFAEQKIDWFGTVRGRVGHVWERALVYVTGGLAYGHARLSTKVLGSGLTDCTITDGWCGSDSKTLAGWTIGGGVEWALADSWSIKAEYLYYRLGGISNTLQFLDPGPLPPQAYASADFKGHIVRGGINYRFGAAPVVAKY
jgi:outer membrane immunogenic protein